MSSSEIFVSWWWVLPNLPQILSLQEITKLHSNDKQIRKRTPQSSHGCSCAPQFISAMVGLGIWAKILALRDLRSNSLWREGSELEGQLSLNGADPKGLISPWPDSWPLFRESMSQVLHWAFVTILSWVGLCPKSQSIGICNYILQEVLGTASMFYRFRVARQELLGFDTWLFNSIQYRERDLVTFGLHKEVPGSFHSSNTTSPPGTFIHISYLPCDGPTDVNKWFIFSLKGKADCVGRYHMVFSAVYRGTLTLLSHVRGGNVM